MKNYSRQVDGFINSKPFASSFYRRTDARTYVTYYIDDKGLIHSSSFNYSIIGCGPVTKDQFLKLISEDESVTITFN